MSNRYSFYEFLDEVRLLPITPMQYLTLMSKVKSYFKYRKRFEDSSTPESEALARWGLNDAESDYNAYCREIGIKAPSLYKLRDAVY